MRPDLKKLLAVIPTLTAPELAEVEKRLRLDRKTRVTSEEVEDDWLYAGIVSELKRRGILSASAKPPVQTLGHGAPEYNRNAKLAREALVRGLNYKPRPPDLLALGRLAARSLADDLQGGPVPICLQVLAQNVHRVVGAVDKDFPDYLRCRQLGFILQRDDDHGTMGSVERVQKRRGDDQGDLPR